MNSSILRLDRRGRIGFRAVVSVYGLAAVLAAVAVSQPFNIDWYTMDGGGGTSTGGSFTLSGTIGQPEAGRMVGGSYTLTGGFWSLAPAALVAPTLYATLFGSEIEIRWASTAHGFVLEEAAQIGPGATWQAANGMFDQSGAETVFRAPAGAGERFYRLKHP